MRSSGTSVRSFVVVGILVGIGAGLGSLAVACGGGGRAPEAAAPQPTAKDADAGAAASADAAPPAPEKPFAGSASDATQLISQALDKRTDDVGKCVKDYRFRKHLAHERVEISVGIDQDGHVLGVTLPKGKKDEQLSACVQDVLKSAPFPRSHSGVITVTRSYEELVQ